MQFLLGPYGGQFLLCGFITVFLFLYLVAGFFLLCMKAGDSDPACYAWMAVTYMIYMVGYILFFTSK